MEKAVEDGEPLCVLDNLILSMVGADEFYPGYEKIHPGGKFLITRNYGRDISKFFYGGYVMMAGQIPHTHTLAALKICEALVVGVVSRQTFVRDHPCKISDRARVNNATSTFELTHIDNQVVHNWK